MIQTLNQKTFGSLTQSSKNMLLHHSALLSIGKKPIWECMSVRKVSRGKKIGCVVVLQAFAPHSSFLYPLSFSALAFLPFMFLCCSHYKKTPNTRMETRTTRRTRKTGVKGTSVGLRKGENFNLQVNLRKLQAQ